MTNPQYPLLNFWSPMACLFHPLQPHRAQMERMMVLAQLPNIHKRTSPGFMHPPRAKMAAHIDRQHWPNTGTTPSAHCLSFLKSPRNCSKDGWPCLSRALATTVWLVRLRGIEFICSVRPRLDSSAADSREHIHRFSTNMAERKWMAPLVIATETCCMSAQHWHKAIAARSADAEKPPRAVAALQSVPKHSLRASGALNIWPRCLVGAVIVPCRRLLVLMSWGVSIEKIYIPFRQREVIEHVLWRWDQTVKILSHQTGKNTRRIKISLWAVLTVAERGPHWCRYLPVISALVSEETSLWIK